MGRMFLRSFVLISILGGATAAAVELPEVGWLALFESGESGVATHASSAAFALEPGEALHPELDAEGWRAIYMAELELQESGRYRFGIEVLGGTGEAWVMDATGRPVTKVESDGGGELVVGEWFESGADALSLRLVYTRRDAGRAKLRLFWEMARENRKGFRMEPVPTSFVRPAQVNFETALVARRGRAMFETKGCSACHAAPASVVGVRRAPDLTEVGARASAEWMARWIAEPILVRRYADMPDVVGDEGEARDIASFLASLNERPVEGEEPAASAPDDATLEEGRALFHGVGCVACHGALVPAAELHPGMGLSSAMPEVDVPAPFGDLRGKWAAGALASFLVDPLASYPDGRMPSLALSEEEAAAIAAYLADHWGARAGEPATPASSGDPERGRALAIERGCAACHELGDVAFESTATPLAALEPWKGCLDPSDEASPRFDLTPEDHRALTLGIRSLQNAKGHPAPIDELHRTLEQMNCTACHVNDGLGGVPGDLRLYFTSEGDEVDLGDEGRFPPLITDAGHKLTTSWLRRLLLEGATSRPYMSARMPQFGEGVAHVPGALARVEGLFPDTDATEPEVTDALVADGRSVMGRDSLGCVACHVYRDYPPSGSPGLDITQFGERLRYEWYREFVADPMRYRPGTRMPAFGRGGISTLKTLYDGDLAAQADAMWAYFSLGEFMPAPDGVEPAQVLQVEVAERPVVLRTFLEHSGSRGIAVGFPNGVHFGFDATRCRLSEVWGGDFLDAAGAWAGRGGAAAGGQGGGLWLAGESAALRLGTGDVEPRFHGYRLDPGGVPTFEYSLGELRVRERFHAERAGGLRVLRELRFTGAPPGETLWLESDGRWSVADSSGIAANSGTAESSDSASVVFESPEASLTLELSL